MSRFRRILVRWEKKPEHNLTCRNDARALIAFRAAGLFGEALNPDTPVALLVFTAGL